MKFGSVCSGIEAASVAWHRYGWCAAWLAEIDKAASHLLAVRFPSVMNLGDMTQIAARIRSGEVEAPDILVGGTPCQSFSVAGLRAGLSDARGQLTIAFIDLANAIDEQRAVRGKPPVIIVWENVPGVLNHADNPLGCFLAGLGGDNDAVEPGPRPEPGRSSAHWTWDKKTCLHRAKWTDAGWAIGPQRSVVWRVLNAEFFGLAQRRRRVFVVASARKGFDPAAVLLEFDGLRRDSAPSREAGEVAPTIPSRSTEGGGIGIDFDCDGGLVQWPAEIAPTLNAAFGSKQGLEDQHIRGGLDYLSVARCVATKTRIDAESETLIPINRCDFDVAHTLRGNGFDASEDGTGRGTPLVPCELYAVQERAVSTNIAVGPQGKGYQQGVAYTLEARNKVQAVAFDMRGREGGAQFEGPHDTTNIHAASGGSSRSYVAFTAKDYGADALNNLSSTLRAGGFTGSHANGGVMPAVSFAENQRGELFISANTDSLSRGGGKPGQGYAAILQGCTVRRLMPVECERLQGFPDGWTAVPVGKKIAADSPRYKQLGNSMAVPVMAWIGSRIDAVLTADAESIL